MMLGFEFLDKRPIIIAIAGSNGAGKSTSFASHLADCGLRFVNADEIAFELDIGPYEAAEAAAAIRETLVERGQSCSGDRSPAPGSNTQRTRSPN